MLNRFKKHLLRDESKVKGIEKKRIDKMLARQVIEPAQTKWWSQLYLPYKQTDNLASA